MPLKLIAAGALAVMAVKKQNRQIAELPPVMSANNATVELQPAPINPDWIIRGNPVARAAAQFPSETGSGMAAVWDCTAGEFRWYFGVHETVVIQEGEVHVTGEDGSQRVLRAGDMACFRKGTWAVWRVDNYVRKVAFMRRPLPGLLVMAVRLRAALRGSQPAPFAG